jgi:hypothetical protein
MAASLVRTIEQMIVRHCTPPKMLMAFSMRADREDENLPAIKTII